MNIDGKPYRTIWPDPKEAGLVYIIDQRYLPYRLVIESLKTVDDVVAAIRDMHIRGAGLIGATAAYGLYLSAVRANRQSVSAFFSDLEEAGNRLLATRPTAVNLRWAVNRCLCAARREDCIDEMIKAVRAEADMISDLDVACCRHIGEWGSGIIEKICREKGGQPVNILTHCNAGWLAFVDYGTATAPIYLSKERGIPVHVYVDETRPLNQGSKLTAFELEQNGVPHTIVTDNAGGHLMQHGLVDLVLVGSDRVTAQGDVANKIGTYLKAIAALIHHIPFYVALPTSTIDWTIHDGIKDIPIEVRSEDEIKSITGLNQAGDLDRLLIAHAESPAINYAFDVTPARFITGLITEKGIFQANRESLSQLRERLDEEHRK